MKKATYVISGTSRGIGLELTTQLLKAGNTVWALARQPETSERLKALLQKYPDHLKIEKVDVTSNASVNTLAQKLSGVPIDVLINNAGTYLDGEADFETLDLKTVTQTFEVNTLGAMRMTQALLPHLTQSTNSKCVHITSLMGSIADNESGGSYAYRMSKTALNMFCKSFSVDFPKIITAVVHPGWVQTEMGGSQAPTTPQESAQGILQVISKLSSEQSGKFFDFEGDTLPW